MAALTLHHSFGLNVFSDVTQALLLLSGTVLFGQRAIHAPRNSRPFWTLVAIASGIWFFYQLIWTYIEVVLRQDVPDVFWGDIILFLHLVPLIAAVALRPHVARDEYAARVGRLDFVLLLTWWIYIYVFLVMSWQYALVNSAAYDTNFNGLYLAEKIVLLVALGIGWLQTKAAWRAFYAHVFGASLIYGATSFLANWAMAKGTYYSGSIYDMPLAASMVWFTLIGAWTKAEEPQSEYRAISTAYGVWMTRLGMIAVFSLPLFAAWTMLDLNIPPPVRSFRVLATLMAALVMGTMVFVRQHLLDRELVHLLQHSRESVDNLQKLQIQVLQQEKFASLGQLVGGAAHELNNPITAMLGYSDLLSNTKLTPMQADLAARIGQHVRHTKSLVASLLSFARKAPASRSLIDMNMLVRTAVSLAQAQLHTLKIEVSMQLDSALPSVAGDSNQLLQLCVQLVSNGIHTVAESGRTLNIRTHTHAGLVVLDVFDATEESAVERSLASLRPMDRCTNLGLSACLRIVQEHNGRVYSQPVAKGGNLVRVELPGEKTADATTISEAAVPNVLPAQSSV